MCGEKYFFIPTREVLEDFLCVFFYAVAIHRTKTGLSVYTTDNTFKTFPLIILANFNRMNSILFSYTQTHGSY